MPYEFKRMTPEERQETLRCRLEHGYPLHASPHPFRGSGCYLLTATNFEHAQIMATPQRRNELETAVVEAMLDIQAVIHGWVVLPNHYHLLVGVEALDSVSAALRRVHGRTSRKWNLADG